MVFYMEKYFTLQTNQGVQFCCKTSGRKGCLGGDAAPVTPLCRCVVSLGQGGAWVRQPCSAQRGCFAVVSYSRVRRSLFALMENVLSPGSLLCQF